MDIEQLYKKRFCEEENEHRRRMWEILCKDYLQRFVPEDGSVVDVGAGYCEFINTVRAAKKFAVDINPETAGCAGDAVEAVKTPSHNLSFLKDSSVDTVFISNLLEHLESREAVVDTLKEAHRVLKEGGRLLLLQPNIRFLSKNYWDYFDHIIPISDRAIVEVLRMTGFEIERLYPRFVPYTIKYTPLKRCYFLLRLYLRIPLLWPVFGRQMFAVCRK